MTPEHAQRSSLSRRFSQGFETFDRVAAGRQRRSPRLGALCYPFLGCGPGEVAELERRSLFDTRAPSRN